MAIGGSIYDTTGVTKCLGNPQIVCNRNIITNSTRQGTANARTDVRLENRYKRTIGNAKVRGLSVLAPAFAIQPTGETSLGNAYVYEAAIELTSPVTFAENLFYTTNLPSILDGYPYVESSTPIGYDFAPGAAFYLRQAVSVASSSNFLPLSTGGSASGDAGYISPSVTSQVPATGSMSQPSGGTGFSTGVGVIIGVPSTPLVAVGYVGDSIPTGVGDSTGSGDTLGNLGFIARGLANVSGNQIPYLQMSVGSWTYATATLSTSPRLRSYWSFLTHIINQLATNDIASGTSLATLQGYATGMWTAQKSTIGPYGKPLKVYQSLVIPRTTSTDSWATAANQTPVAGFATGTGVRDLFNAWVKTQVGNGVLDGYIDPNQFVEDPSHPGCWITNGSANYPTVDGIHPSTVVHILAAQAVNSWALTISA